MASVSNYNAKKYQHLYQDEEDDTKPQADTLRDKILKHFLHRQLRSSFSLSQQIESQRKFIKSTTEESITSSTNGLISLKDYKNLENCLALKEILKSSGLSDSEIELLLSEDDENSSLENPFSRQKKLREIDSKLSKRQDQLQTFNAQPEQFNGAIPLNRHDFEEEISVIPQSEVADKLSACLVRLEPDQDDTISADHPINHIKQLSEELFPRDAYASNGRPKKRKAEDSYEEKVRKREIHTTPKIIYLKEKPKTYWDMKNIPRIVENCGIQVEKKGSKGCLPAKKDVHSESNVCVIRNKIEEPEVPDPSKPFVMTLDPADLIPLDVILSNRKTLQDLKAMEKFKNYEAGIPSQTLYIKNLSPKVTPHDLVAILGNFESCSQPRIQYRILNRHMKGQAFVTFPSADIATNALNTCNGFLLYEKPLVIAFGRK